MAKVMISLPDDLLERIDAEARRRQTSRSALLRDAVKREISEHDPEAIQAAISRARQIVAKADRGVSLDEAMRQNKEDLARRGTAFFDD